VPPPFSPSPVWYCGRYIKDPLLRRVAALSPPATRCQPLEEGTVLIPPPLHPRVSLRSCVFPRRCCIVGVGIPPAGVFPGPGAPPAFPAYQPDAATTEAEESTPKIHFIYSEEAISMEEKRAEAPRYRYDDAIQQQVSALDKSVESRLASITGATRGA